MLELISSRNVPILTLILNSNYWQLKEQYNFWYIFWWAFKLLFGALKDFQIGHTCRQEKTSPNHTIVSNYCWWFSAQHRYLTTCSLSFVTLAYNDSLQDGNQICTKGDYFEQGDDVVGEKKACQFKRSFLRQCSGLADSNFGYSEGQPCILVKMNRVSHMFLCASQ